MNVTELPEPAHTPPAAEATPAPRPPAWGMGIPPWPAEPTADLVAALGALQEVPKAGKADVQSQRGSYSYRYLELPDLLSHVRTVFAQHRLAVMQVPTVIEGGVSVVTLIVHASGHVWPSPPLNLRANGLAQDVGGAITYGRRYSLAALVGLAGGEDDDAAAVSGRQATQERPQPRNKPNRAENPPERQETPEATPAGMTEYPDAGAPSRTNPASVASKRMFWALLRKTGMDAEQIKSWVAAVLTIEPEWHTDSLTQAQVSIVIDRLRTEEPPPDETPPEGETRSD